MHMAQTIKLNLLYVYDIYIFFLFVYYEELEDFLF